MKRFIFTAALLLGIGLTSFRKKAVTIQDAYREVQSRFYFSGCNGCAAGRDKANAWLHENGLPADKDVYDYFNAYGDSRYDRDEQLDFVGALDY